MAINCYAQRGSIALLAACSLAMFATAGQPYASANDKGADQGGEALQSDLQSVSGHAVGTILMPNTSGLGILVAVGQTADSRVFMLDTELTSAIPGLFGPQTRVAFGGIYGRLFEAPGGDGAAFDGVVEGMWRMDKSLVGHYHAIVYENKGRGGLVPIGRIQGSFRVAEQSDSDEGMPAPVVIQPTKSDQLGGDGPLADSNSRWVPYGDDVVWTEAGWGAVVQPEPKALPLSGDTRLQFKLIE